MKTQTETLIHIAGVYSPDTGQDCMICGKNLVPQSRNPWDPEGARPSTFPLGHLVMARNGQKFDLTANDQDQDDHPDARLCKLSDNPDLESRQYS